MNWLTRRFKTLWCRWKAYRLSKRHDIPPPTGRHYFLDSAYIALGRNLEKHCKHAQRLNEHDSHHDIPGELIYAHDLLLGIIASILEANAGQPIPTTDENVRRRFVLSAAFIQGILLCVQSITRGLYIQAGSLIRQEYEVVILLHEILEKKRKDGKKANPVNSPWGHGKELNPILCDLAHLSRHHLLEKIVGYNTTWGDYASFLPQYRKDKTAEFYGLHTGLVLNLVRNLILLYSQIAGYKPDTRELDVLKTVSGILMKHQVMAIPIMVSNLDTSVLFYQKVLAVAGYKLFIRDSNEAVFVLKEGQNNFGNVVLVQGTGGVARHGHITIEVPDIQSVKEFHNVALEGGGRDGGNPTENIGERGKSFETFIFDFDNNKIGVCAVKK